MSRRGILSVSGGLWRRSWGIRACVTRILAGDERDAQDDGRAEEEGAQVGKHARPRVRARYGHARDSTRSSLPIVTGRHLVRKRTVTLRVRPWKLAPPSNQSVVGNSRRETQRGYRKSVALVFKKEEKKRFWST